MNGILEAKCFAIRIGLSCDLAIHSSHSYAALPGHLDSHEWTKYALIYMGPSILAADETSVTVAMVLLFADVILVVMFAIFLFVTVLQATAVSFVIFLDLVDCFGLLDPTYVADKVVDWLCRKKGQEVDYTSKEHAGPYRKPLSHKWKEKGGS